MKLSYAQHLPVYGALKSGVTLMPIVETGPKLNLSEILCLSSLSASLMKCQSQNGHYCPDKIFPIICLCETKGQVTLI